MASPLRSVGVASDDIVSLLWAKRHSASVVYPDGLIEREVEVLRLVAAGRTSQEIGDEFFIALRIVTTHVASILHKTGSADHAEAASYANRHGLV